MSGESYYGGFEWWQEAGAYPNMTAFHFQAAAQPMAVYDEDGTPIGLTVKLGDYPMMMLPLVPIPDTAVRFDPEREDLQP